MPDQTELTEQVVITAREVAEVGTQPPGVRPATTIPVWAAILSSVLALFLPLLCIFAVIMRLVMRGRNVTLRARWISLLCTLLVVSGLLNTVATAYVLVFRTSPRQVHVPLTLGLMSHDWADSFPTLPSESPMSPVEIAARTKPLVFIVLPDPGKTVLSQNYLDTASMGAAMMLAADGQGYLLGTNRHVADAPRFFLQEADDKLVVVSSQGSYASAEVVARHKSLDLALLWVIRRSGKASFRQPITKYSEIAVGSPVFVIGHPQRLFFTLSTGLVSRVGGDDAVQLSAPISPGNSGGPAYDSSGNLVAVVTSTVDKQFNPNAENLNFATRADAFLTEDGWNFRSDGKAILKRFIQPASIEASK